MMRGFVWPIPVAWSHYVGTYFILMCYSYVLYGGAEINYYTDNQNLRRYVCTTSTCNGAGSKIPAGAGQQLNSGPFRGRAGRGLHAWYSPISESQRLYKFCQIVSSESFSNKTMMHRWCQWDKFAKLAPVQAIDHILAPASSVGSHLHSDTHKRTKTFLQTATVVTIANWGRFERSIADIVV